MVHKRYKSQAAAQILSNETNVHFLNPNNRKIDLNMFIKHLHQKDENADLELNTNVHDYSSYSDNQFITAFNSSSEADDEFSSSNDKPVKRSPCKRRGKSKRSKSLNMMVG